MYEMMHISVLRVTKVYFGRKFTYIFIPIIYSTSYAMYESFYWLHQIDSIKAKMFPLHEWIKLQLKFLVFKRVGFFFFSFFGQESDFLFNFLIINLLKFAFLSAICRRLLYKFLCLCKFKFVDWKQLRQLYSLCFSLH